MPILVNLRHLASENVRLRGELPAPELDIDARDEMIRVSRPLVYDLEVQKLEDGLLVQGRLELPLDCKCVRCLKAFERRLRLATWAAHLPLEGEEAVPVMNDCVDLTPIVREDILLEFPQHPLCKPECRGLAETSRGQKSAASGPGDGAGSPAWAALNKLKFK
jgi:uncharacterized protein